MTAFPLIRWRSASACASVITGASSAIGISSVAEIGLATNCPPAIPNARRIRCAQAMVSELSMRSGAAKGEAEDQNAGNASCPYAITGTPSVSS